jgi:hypothetical protein
VKQVSSIQTRTPRLRSVALFAVATIAAVMTLGVLTAFAQALQMDPPVLTPEPAAAVGVSWLPVEPVGSNETTYTLSYDTTFPFTATQTVTTTHTVSTIAGIDGVTYYAFVQADDGSGVLSDPSAVGQAMADGVAPDSVPSPNGANGWFTSSPGLISVVDTGTPLQSFSVNGADVSADVIFGLPPEPSKYTVALVEGNNDFTFSGTDVAGNVETTKSLTLKMDSVAPTCSIAVSSNGPVTRAIVATITAGDAVPGSGVEHIEYVFLPRGSSPSGATAWKSVAGALTTTVTPAGQLTLFARSVDVAGNVSSVQHADVFYDSRIATKLTIKASRSTLRRGQSVKYSGKLSPVMPVRTHVSVQIRKSGSSKWTTLSVRSTDSHHNWSYTYTQRTRARGTYYVRVRYAGNVKYLPYTSASKRLVIK